MPYQTLEFHCCMPEVTNLHSIPGQHTGGLRQTVQVYMCTELVPQGQALLSQLLVSS